MNLLLLSLFILTNTITPVDSLTTSSSIVEVTVFRQQAQIVRQAKIDLKEGKNIIVFERLSPTLKQRSVQLKANGKFTVLSLSQRYNYFSEQRNNPEIQILENQRDSLQQEITFHESDRNVIDSELRLLESTTSNIGNKELTAAELTQFLDLFRTRSGNLKKEQITINELLTNKREELNKVVSQIRELNGGQQSRFSEVIAEVNSDEAQTLTFTISYLARSAGWVPSYDIRSENISNPLNITYKAEVYQNTGVDWDNVDVTISSGNPTANAILPDLAPSYVDFFNTVPSVAKQRSMASDLIISGYSDAGELSQNEVLLEAEAPLTEFTQNQTSFSYKINTPYSIPSDGKAHTVEINRAEVETDYSYSTTPKLSQHAYLIGKMSDWDQLNLIPGDGSIYFENNFVGTTALNPGSFNDTLTVSLGRDESINVERNKLREFEERNFFGNRVREKNAWEISIRNTKSEPISITVQDQIPVSRNENIEVKATRLSNGNLDKETGIITWELIIEANSTKALRFDYQVEYPTGQRISY